MESKELAVIVERSGLEKTKAQTVLDEFTDFFAQASEWEAKTRDLVITDASQVKEMALARSGRLQLREIRVNAEKTKKKLKENILVEGRFIDAIYNLVEGVTKPIEAALLEKEKFVERIEEAKKEAIAAERAAKLAPYGDLALITDLKLISEEGFERILEDARAAYEARKAREYAEAKEAEDRAKAEAEERKRIAEENVRLKADAEAREAAIEAERKAEREVREEADRVAKVERDRIEAERIKAQEEADKLRKAEADRIEAERKAKKEAEEKAAAEARAKEEADRKAAAAGDREKVLTYISAIEGVTLPAVKSPEARAILAAIITQIAAGKAAAGTKL